MVISNGALLETAATATKEREKTIGMTQCPLCGGEVEYKTDIPREYRYRGSSIVLGENAYYCKQCDETFQDKKDVLRNEKALLAFHREVDHLLTPESIRRIRKDLGLTQEEAAELFGGGQRAFSKYETAKAAPGRSLDILLRLLAEGKISLEEVRQAAGVQDPLKVAS